MAGRRPKPTALKLVEGNPGKRPLNKREPKPRVRMPSPPAWLTGEAKRHFQRVGKKLVALGLLTDVDRDAFGAYCAAYARMAKAEAMVKEQGEVVRAPKTGVPMANPWLSIARQERAAAQKLLVEFGLTPAARSKVEVTKPAGNDDDGFF